MTGRSSKSAATTLVKIKPPPPPPPPPPVINTPFEVLHSGSEELYRDTRPGKVLWSAY